MASAFSDILMADFRVGGLVGCDIVMARVSKIRENKNGKIKVVILLRLPNTWAGWVSNITPNDVLSQNDYGQHPYVVLPSWMRNCFFTWNQKLHFIYI